MKLIRRLLWLYRAWVLDRKERSMVQEMSAQLVPDLPTAEALLLMERFEAIDSIRTLRGAPSLRTLFYKEWAPSVRPSAEWPVTLIERKDA